MIGSNIKSPTVHETEVNINENVVDDIATDPTSLESLTATLSKYDEIIISKQRDVFMLNESFKRLKQEKQVVLRFLEKSKESKNSRYNELSNKLKALEAQLQSEDSEFQKAFEKEKKAITKEMDKEIERERKDYEEAENELKRHEDLKKEMEEYEKEMEFLNQRKQNFDKQLKKIKYDFMLKMAIENQKLERNHESNFQEELYKDKEEAETQIKKLGIDIHENNLNMNEKSVLQRFEIEKIKKQKMQIMKLNKSYKRDMMLNAETMEEYSKRYPYKLLKEILCIIL